MNGLTDDKVMLWDRFKTFVREAFINQKAHVNKKRHEVTEKLIKELAILEAKHKSVKTKELKQELEAKVNELKLLEATAIAKEVLYARQQFFEYKDRPNR